MSIMRGIPPGAPKEVWGPVFWRWLHVTAVAYPPRPTPAARRAARAFVYDLFCADVPCLPCRRHLERYLARHPPDLGSSAAFQRWAWRLHNRTNEYLGKPLFTEAEYLAAYPGGAL